MRPNIDHRIWILLSWYISLQCISGAQQQTKQINGNNHNSPKYQLKRQIADSNDNDDDTIKPNIMLIKTVSHHHHHPSNEYNSLKRDISRVPLNNLLLTNNNNDNNNNNLIKNGQRHNTIQHRIHRSHHVHRQPVSYPLSSLSLLTKLKNDIKYESDNAEGGGDKEFYTDEDIYLNDLTNNNKYEYNTKSQRHRRSYSTNQYTNHSTVPLPLDSLTTTTASSATLTTTAIAAVKTTTTTTAAATSNVSSQKQQEKQQISKFANTHQHQLPPPLPPTSSSSSSSSILSSYSPSLIASVSNSQIDDDVLYTNSALGKLNKKSTTTMGLSSGYNSNSSSTITINKKIETTNDDGSSSTSISSDGGSNSNSNINRGKDDNSISSSRNINELDIIANNKNANSDDEQIIIITNDDVDDDAVVDDIINGELNSDSNTSNVDGDIVSINDGIMVDGMGSSFNENDELMMNDEPRVLPLRPIIRGPYDDEHQGEMSVVYAEPHTEVKLNCDVDLDIATTVWMKDGQMVHTTDRNSRPTDNRFIRELRGGLTITNAMLEDDGKWQCEAENARGYVENARPVKLVVLDRPKPPYLLIDSRRLDAGNIFVPVKENSELSLACISEGGNPKPTLSWEVLLSPGVDRHSQKVAAEVLELQEVKNEKNADSYKSNSGAKSEARMPAVYRAHHNARILCVMEHPTLKMRQNASLLLDVQYTPSFAISRTPGFGYPLREGIEVSLKCDVDSNPPSTPLWQKDDGDTPVSQIGDGFLNFTSIRREHSGWYKCTSRHLNFQYSSIGYYLSVRYDSVDVTSEPLEQDLSVAASHNPNKRPQLEVQLGGAVTLQCPQGSLGCWSHLDPVSARLRGLGIGLTTPTGQFSLKDVVYQDAGVYKCIGQSPNNKKKVEVIHTVAVQVKGPPTVTARNHTPVAYPGSPLHLSVEFCANPPAFAARWLHGDRIYTPGNQYGIDVLAYGVNDLPTPFCKEARLTYVHMHERVPRTFYFVVSSPGGVAETIFHVNFTLKHKVMSNSIGDDEEELSEPEEIHFPVFGGGQSSKCIYCKLIILLMCFICIISVL